MLSCLGGCFEPCNHHLPEVYPQNNQISVHLNEFLKDGYRLSAEAVEVRFPHVDGSRLIHQGSVGITDGYTKLIIMTGILVIAHSLEAQPTYLWECLKVGDPETLLDLTIGKCKKNPSHSQFDIIESVQKFSNGPIVTPKPVCQSLQLRSCHGKILAEMMLPVCSRPFGMCGAATPITGTLHSITCMPCDSKLRLMEFCYYPLSCQL